MQVKIKLDLSAISDLSMAAERAAKKATDALHTEVIGAQVMPFASGDMQNQDTFTDETRDGESIRANLITDAPQARRLYYHPEYNFQKVKNPNAGGMWLDPWITGDQKDFVADTFIENFKEEAKL